MAIAVSVTGASRLPPTAFRTRSITALAEVWQPNADVRHVRAISALVLPSDLYRSESVATVSGMSGTGAGLGTIISTYLIGYVSDRYSFEPILIAASLVPLVGMVLVLLLIREKRISGAPVNVP